MSDAVGNKSVGAGLILSWLSRQQTNLIESVLLSQLIYVHCFFPDLDTNV